MSRFTLQDWNDARLLLACIRRGSFSAAAQALGMDQATVSRRVAAIERDVGRPLFTRRKGGARPTAAGLILAEQAEALEEKVHAFERVLRGLAEVSSPPVAISASDGITAYLLTPALYGSPHGPLPLAAAEPRQELPPLTFVPDGADADIAVLTLAPGQTPDGSGATRVRHIGTMRFVPIAAKPYLDQHRTPARFEALARHPLLDIALYRRDHGLAAWNELIALCPHGAELTVPTTNALHQPLVAGRGIALLPTYAPLYDGGVHALDMAVPEMAIELWLSAHEDSLREPSVRAIYDTLARMFLASPWFR